jgi:serine/threonine protein phosphatase 1
MRRVVLGDKHGAYKAMLQVFERSGFNPDTDLLIDLGDVADGWSQTYECVELLLSCKNLISIKGNHDDWWLEYLHTGSHPANFKQGAAATLESYRKKCEPVEIDGRIYSTVPHTIPQSHLDFFKNQLPYYIDEKNNVFVHGGFNRHFPIKEQPVPDIYWWDRDLLMQALSAGTVANPYYSKLRYKDKDINRIFIGHTSTINWKEKEDITKSGIIVAQSGPFKTTPMFADTIVNVDTGAGFKGKLTIMDIDTLEYWQSDMCNELYANEKGRE